MPLPWSNVVFAVPSRVFVMVGCGLGLVQCGVAMVICGSAVAICGVAVGTRDLVVVMSIIFGLALAISSFSVAKWLCLFCFCS